METFNAIKKRRTIRKFKSKDISNKDLSKILEAGNLAPCASNLPNWRFVIIQSDEDKTKIAKACFRQEWVKDASVLIIVCSINDRLESLFGERGSLYAVQNTAAAVENMLLMATDLGIASAWVGAFDTDEVIRVIESPETIHIHAIVALGYANEKKSPPKMKLPDLVFFDKWGKSQIGKDKKRKLADWMVLKKKL